MSDSEENTGGGWPQRPWVMAAVGAIAGVIFWLLVDMNGGAEPPPVRQAAATLVAVSALAFLICADRLRLVWAIAFALVSGVIVAMIGFYTASYNQAGEIVEFPFLSALLAVGIAGPLFQVIRDEGRPAVPYAALHRYVWTDAIIGAASLAFTLLTFLMTFLLSQLFDAIGITVFRKLMEKGWFIWMLSGLAFGAASAILRERAPLLGTLQRLVTVVASVLAPVLAGALALFLLALPATGFAGLWKSGIPETPMLLAAAAFAFALLNAIIGDSGDDRGKGWLWRATEIGLLGSVLPLAVLALVSMSMRVGQYGWTPERLWGVIACVVAIACGLANWVAWLRRRSAFDAVLRDYQKKLAIGVCGLALLLALPVFDFGAISSRSQLARLESGKVPAEEFDWAAMAFEFGPSGRRALEAIAESGPRAMRALASRALESKTRYSVADAVNVVRREADIDRRIRIASPDLKIDGPLRQYLAQLSECEPPNLCALLRIDERRVAFITSYGPNSTNVVSRIIHLDQLNPTGGRVEVLPIEPKGIAEVGDLASATFAVRDVPRRQVFINGKPVGDPFE